MPSEAGAGPSIATLVACAGGPLPVLRNTAAELARLRSQGERVQAAELGGAILRDSLMTLQVLRFLSAHRTRSQNTDITTIAHALIMLGHARFFREFESLPVLEDRLDARTLAAVRARMIRSRLAALLARELAVQRHDIDPEEVMIAAALHEIPELLALIAGYAGEGDLPRVLRSDLLRRLDVPALLVELNEDAPAPNPRVVNVHLACRIARHCHAGWPQAALRDDLAELQRFLRTSEPQAWERVRKVVLAAAREWRYYDSLPAAAWMPFMPGDENSS